MNDGDIIKQDWSCTGVHRYILCTNFTTEGRKPKTVMPTEQCPYCEDFDQHLFRVDNRWIRWCPYCGTAYTLEFESRYERR